MNKSEQIMYCTKYSSYSASFIPNVSDYGFQSPTKRLVISRNCVHKPKRLVSKKRLSFTSSKCSTPNFTQHVSRTSSVPTSFPSCCTQLLNCSMRTRFSNEWKEKKTQNDGAKELVRRSKGTSAAWRPSLFLRCTAHCGT